MTNVPWHKPITEKSLLPWVSIQALCWNATVTHLKLLKTQITCALKLQRVCAQAPQRRDLFHFFFFFGNSHLSLKKRPAANGYHLSEAAVALLPQSLLGKLNLASPLEGTEAPQKRTGIWAPPQFCFNKRLWQCGSRWLFKASKPRLGTMFGKEQTDAPRLFWTGLFSRKFVRGREKKTLPFCSNIALPLFTHDNTQKHDS